MSKDTTQTTIEDKTEEGYVIINPYGNIWCGRLFKYKADAYRYLEEFWGRSTWLNKFDKSEWMVAKATKTLSVKTISHQVDLEPLEKPSDL